MPQEQEAEHLVFRWLWKPRQAPDTGRWLEMEMFAFAAHGFVALVVRSCDGRCHNLHTYDGNELVNSIHCISLLSL